VYAIKNQKNATIQFRLTQELKDDIFKRAMRQGVYLSTYLEDAVKEKIAREDDNKKQ
jgi:hypothetical protein